MEVNPHRLTDITHIYVSKIMPSEMEVALPEAISGLYYTTTTSSKYRKVNLGKVRCIYADLRQHRFT